MRTPPDDLNIEQLHRLLTPDQLSHFQDLVKTRDLGSLLGEESHQRPWWCAEPHQMHQDLSAFLQYDLSLPQWNQSSSGDTLVYNLLALASVS